MTWIVYWPVLVACWALVRLGRLRSSRFDAVSAVSAVSVVEAGILLALIGAGSVLTAGSNLSSTLGRSLGADTAGDVWSLTRNNYEFTERHESPVQAGGVIEILNRYGDIEIRREAGARVEVTVRKIVRAATVEDAARMNEAFAFRIERTARGVRILSSLDAGGRFPDRERYRSRLVVVAPVDAVVKADSRRGAVHEAE